MTLPKQVAVLSDVHGNVTALQAVLEVIRNAPVDIVVYGGDLSWGHQPRETLSPVREAAEEFDSRYVLGNAESALIRQTRSAGQWDKELTSRERWMREIHSPDDVAFIESFVATVSVNVESLGPTLFCHGSPSSNQDCVTAETTAERFAPMLDSIVEKIVVSAHTHHQFDRQIAGVRSVNAGSVGMPYEGRPGADGCGAREPHNSRGDNRSRRSRRTFRLGPGAIRMPVGAGQMGSWLKTVTVGCFLWWGDARRCALVRAPADRLQLRRSGLVRTIDTIPSCRSALRKASRA